MTLVSVVVPARNEESDIAACLAAVLEQTWPADSTEVIVVDGGSTDATAEVARSVLAGSKLAHWEVVANPSGATPANLNAGLRAATGDYLCRVDARSLVPPEYVETCVEVMERRPDVAVVGGMQIADARDRAGMVGRGIARALRNPYATGLSRYRRNARSGPSDTVYLGFFRTGDLRAAGGWDERYATNQDFELNERMRRTGLVWFDERLRVRYRPRARLPALAAQYRRFGRWKAAAWIEHGRGLSPRHLGLVAAPPVAAVVALAAARRRPAAVAATAGAGLLALDSLTGEPAPAAERVAAGAATVVVAASWWWGIAEQAVRAAAGQRLLTPPPELEAITKQNR